MTRSWPPAGGNLQAWQFVPKRAIPLALSALLALAPVSLAQAQAENQRAAADALRQGKDAVAVEVLSKQLATASLGNDRRAILLTDRGAAQVRLQRFRAALDDFNQAAVLSPEHAPVYVNRGNLLLVLGDTEEALRDFDRAALFAPEMAAVFASRGAAHLAASRPELAVANYTRAISLSPRDPVFLAGRGRGHLAAGRLYEAIRDFSRAASLNEAFGQAYRNRAEARLRVGQFAEAASDLSRFLAFDPSRLPEYRSRAEAYLASGNHSAAMRDFDHLLAVEPKSAAAYEGRALTMARTGSFEDAQNELARAIDLDPRRGRSYAIRAYIYVRTGQPQLAERDLERALQLMPGSADAYWIEGEVSEANGRTDVAVASFGKALEIDRHHWLAREALSRLGYEAKEVERPLGSSTESNWQIVAIGTRFVARNPDFPQLRIPLEMAGPGEPRLLEWSRQSGPNASFATLRYSAGVLPALPGGSPLPQENLAVVDLARNVVPAIFTAKLGSSSATLDWAGTTLAAIGADGVRDEIELRPQPSASAEAAAPIRRSTDHAPARKPSLVGQMPSWSPWATNDAPPARRSAAERRQEQRRNQPKSIFDLLFGN